MKKLLIVLLVGLFAVGVANACPHGEHPYGGTGPHHKGGWCA
ncbi:MULTISPECIES: hypothetical protein [Photobacterium]|nr:MULTISPECIES: hypothetical protein [Photobacterium]